MEALASGKPLAETSQNIALINKGEFARLSGCPNDLWFGPWCSEKNCAECWQSYLTQME
jgi:hypothetical protein